MDPQILMQINEIYRNEVYARETLSEAKADEGLTPLQKIRKRNKRDSESLVSRPGGQTDERRSYHKAGRGEKKEKGAKSAFGTMRHVGGPYNEETLSDAELADINQWISQLISEGYDLDDYSDEELYAAYLEDLDEAKKTVMSVTSPSGERRTLNTTRAMGPARSPIDPNYVLRDIGSRKKGQEGISFTPSAEKKARTRGQEQISRSRQAQRNSRARFITRKLQTKFGIPDSALDPQERSKGILYKAADIREYYELDLYDIVSDYLVSEGFCDSYEDADVIMVNMSEEWVDGILDEVTGGGQVRFREGLPGKSPKKAGMKETPQQKSAKKLGRLDVDPTTDPQRRARLAKVALR